MSKSLTIVKLADNDYSYEGIVLVPKSMEPGLYLFNRKPFRAKNLTRDDYVEMGSQAVSSIRLRYREKTFYEKIDEDFIDSEPSDEIKIKLRKTNRDSVAYISKSSFDKYLNTFRVNKIPIFNELSIPIKYGENDIVVVQFFCDRPTYLGTEYEISSDDEFISFEKKAIFNKNFDFNEIGIGGLDREAGIIFRRAFSSHLLPGDFIQKIDLSHIKGILLHGPPGTGKTLIARKIGQLLTKTPPQIINGPELFDKYVGESESKLRAIFRPAREEYELKGANSSLHVIIIDEIDAMCASRGSSGSDSVGGRINDNMVTQLLSILDGSDVLNNILVIGMTNRKEVIDDALLRPGRLEIHLEIHLPDRNGREQIFNIHTAKLRENNVLDDDYSIEYLLDETDNYTGAEIAGVVKSAISFATSEQVDFENPENIDTSCIKVGHRHFKAAVAEIDPAFGTDKKSIMRYYSYGVILFNEKFTNFYNNIVTSIDHFLLSSKTTKRILFLDEPGTGKSAIAAKLSLYAKMAYSKVIGPHTVGDKSKILENMFENAFASRSSLIVIDNLETLLGYNTLTSCDSRTLQTLIKYLNVPPIDRDRKLLIIATSSSKTMIESAGLDTLFEVISHIPRVDDMNSLTTIAHELKMDTRGLSYKQPITVREAVNLIMDNN